MRNVVNKPENKKCEICEQEISSYGFSSHIKNVHNIDVDVYVEKYGEFRKNKLNKKPSCRKVNKIKCGECGWEFSSVGMFVHIRDSHGMTKEDYVKKHGEYNQKKIKIEKVDKGEIGEYVCLIDGKKFESSTQLYGYVKRNYKLSSEDYVLKYIFNGENPKCECGCGESVEILSYPPYKRDYVFGHGNKGENNGMYGKTHLEKSLRIMSEKATERINKYIKSGGKILPMNTVCMMRDSQEFRDLIKSKVRESYISYLFDGERLAGKVIPLFSRDDYLTANDSYKFKCCKCSTEFESDLSAGKIPKCPKCFPRYKSYAEYEIENVIINNFPDIKVERGNRKILSDGMEIDLYLPDKKIAIEYDGIVWHSELFGKKDKNYHLRKTEECEKLGIRLIHIFENEWENKREIVTAKLLSILGKRKNSIFARNCEIKIPTSEEKRIFFNVNHIQGNCHSSVYYGLYHDGKLVSLMSFGHRRLVLGGNFSNKDHYELVRYASDINFQVMGGASKLLNRFIIDKKPKHIVTYADRRWSGRENMYEKIGFKFVSESGPNYFYFHKDTKFHLEHRFNYRKSMIKSKFSNFNESISEWENMKMNGYDRIWDCGTLKYEMVVK